MDEARVLNCSAMWEAIDRGSWVTPQLVATAYLIDPDFRSHLVQRLENRCAISVPAGLSPLQRHSATGPAGAVQRSAKLQSALMSIGKRAPTLAPLLEPFSSDPEFMKLLKEDRDRSGEIAASWGDQVVAVFSERNLSLAPRFS